MFVLWVITYIYGLGVMFSLCLFLYALAGVIANKSSLKELAHLSKKLPAGAIIASGYSLIWPVMLFKDQGFREVIIECGRIVIPLSYLFSALVTFQYPMIWVWFITFFSAWFVLEKYHGRQALPHPRE